MQERLLEKLGDLTDDGLATTIQDLFNEIDLDGSGEIDKYEFNEALVKLGVKLKPREIANLVAEVDKDGSGTISFPEFMQMIKSLLQKAKVHVDSRKLEQDMAAAQENMDEQLQNKPDEEEERLPTSCFSIRSCRVRFSSFRHSSQEPRSSCGWVNSSASAESATVCR